MVGYIDTLTKLVLDGLDEDPLTRPRLTFRPKSPRPILLAGRYLSEGTYPRPSPPRTATALARILAVREITWRYTRHLIGPFTLPDVLADREMRERWRRMNEALDANGVP